MSSKTIATGLPHRTVLAVVAGLMAFSLTTGAFANNTPDEALLRASRLFEVGNHDTKTIANRRDVRDYRVCVRDVRLSVPVKVLHDSQSSVVYPGDCANFEAHKLALAPANKLANDMILMGRYEYLKG